MARPAGVRNGRFGGEAAGFMHLIERYLFRQLLGPTLLATLALAVVGMLSLSLGALDIIVHQGQSPWVLLKITLLAMPQLLVLILQSVVQIYEQDVFPPARAAGPPAATRPPPGGPRRRGGPAAAWRGGGTAHTPG